MTPLLTKRPLLRAAACAVLALAAPLSMAQTWPARLCSTLTTTARAVWAGQNPTTPDTANRRARAAL